MVREIGAPDNPKSFAAMRYTESRLSSYPEILLKELEQSTVDYTFNFDGTLQEPKILPVRLLNILLNGAAVIAVRMTTNIPSHNIIIVSDVIIALLTDPFISLEHLLKYMKEPDFPTNAKIITFHED